MRKRTPERTEMQEWVRILHDTRTVLVMARVPATDEMFHTATLFVNSSNQGEPVQLTKFDFVDYAD